MSDEPIDLDALDALVAEALRARESGTVGDELVPLGEVRRVVPRLTRAMRAYRELADWVERDEAHPKSTGPSPAAERRIHSE